jgi:type IV secretion system protein VirD4
MRESRVIIGRRWGWPIYAEKSTHTLMVGATRSGKTTSGILPNALLWKGSLIAASSKGEVMMETYRERLELGPVWCLDLRPGGYRLPEGVLAADWSPLHGLASRQHGWDRARGIAQAMSGVTQQKGSGGDPYWAERGASLLAPVMWAAAINGKPLSRVLEWLREPDISPARAIIESEIDKGRRGAKEAYHQLSEFAGGKLTEGGHGSSIVSSAVNALSWAGGRVLERCDIGTFAPEILVTSGTLYIISPSISSSGYGGAPAVVGVLDALWSATRDAKEHENPERAEQLWLLDEVANIAPVPLTNLLSESAGYGITLAVAVQSYAQLENRWGQEEARAIVDNSVNKLIWGGLSDATFLRVLEAIGGETTMAVRGGRGARERRPSWPVERIKHLPKRSVLVYSHRRPRKLKAAYYKRLWSIKHLLELRDPKDHRRRTIARIVATGVLSIALVVMALVSNIHM